MSQAVTLRLPDETADAVKRIAQRERRSMSDVGAWMIEEWVRQYRFARIEFRSFHGLRQACVRGRLQVWQVIMVARDYEMDVEKTAQHLGLTHEQVESAFQYYSAYPEEIDAALEENDSLDYDTLKRRLPGLSLFEVVPEGPASVEPESLG